MTRNLADERDLIIRSDAVKAVGDIFYYEGIPFSGFLMFFMNDMLSHCQEVVCGYPIKHQRIIEELFDIPINGEFVVDDDALDYEAYDSDFNMCYQGEKLTGVSVAFKETGKDIGQIEGVHVYKGGVNVLYRGVAGFNNGVAEEYMCSAEAGLSQEKNIHGNDTRSFVYNSTELKKKLISVVLNSSKRNVFAGEEEVAVHVSKGAYEELDRIRSFLLFDEFSRMKDLSNMPLYKNLRISGDGVTHEVLRQIAENESWYLVESVVINGENIDKLLFENMI